MSKHKRGRSPYASQLADRRFHQRVKPPKRKEAGYGWEEVAEILEGCDVEETKHTILAMAEALGHRMGPWKECGAPGYRRHRAVCERCQWRELDIGEDGHVGPLSLAHQFPCQPKE